MPGIDYAQLRHSIRIADVLRLASFEAADAMGDQLRGPCPIHGSSSPTNRSFSANLSKNNFRCFKCGASGNQLDLWVAFSKLPLHEAARDLCQRLGLNVPEVRRWQSAARRNCTSGAKYGFLFSGSCRGVHRCSAFDRGSLKGQGMSRIGSTQ